MKLLPPYRIEQIMRLMYATFLLLLAGTVSASPFAGTWTINHEETDKVAVKFKDGSGVSGNRWKPQVSIGPGLPLPQSFKQAPMSNLSPKDPEVLRCTTMTIAPEGKRIKLDYDEAEKETLVKGEYRGRKTRWNKKEIEQKYRTPDRKVTKTWTLREDGRLLVSVKLNPHDDSSRRYNRVFDRVP